MKAYNFNSNSEENGKKLFRNPNKINLFNRFQSRPSVERSGRKENGTVWFQWANGNVEEYSDREFAALAEEMNIEYFKKEDEKEMRALKREEQQLKEEGLL